MEEYNRDGPPEESASWVGIITPMVVGFLSCGLLCLVAALLFITIGGNAFAGFTAVFLAPLAALFGGIMGIWMTWNRSKRPPS